MARDPLQTAADYLNGVKSVGQERAAIGAVLNYLHDGYKAAESLPYFNAYDTNTVNKILDSHRFRLESDYSSLPSCDTCPVDSNWPSVHQRILAAYVEASGPLAAGSNTVPLSVSVQILGDAISNAPSVFLGAVGQATGAILNEAGAAAGTGIAALVKKSWLLVLLIIVGAIVARKAKLI